MTTPTERLTTRRHGRRTAINWTLALLSVLGALAIVGYAYLQVLGTAACSQGSCGGVGPSQTVFGVIEYGVPIVAVVAVALSFITARRPYGIVVPAVSWVVIVAAAVVLYTTF